MFASRFLLCEEQGEYKRFIFLTEDISKGKRRKEKGKSRKGRFAGRGSLQPYPEKGAAVDRGNANNDRMNLIAEFLITVMFLYKTLVL
ncbi:MAG: hypothetical protein RBT43_03950 [bacterium]|nr:hypothetical protein [bacterium]